MKKKLNLIEPAILCVCAIICVIMYVISPKDEPIKEWVIIKKHIEPKHETHGLQYIENIPFGYEETVPTKYYFDIKNHTAHNKTRTTTIEVTKKIYNQYKTDDIWYASDTN